MNELVLLKNNNTEIISNYTQIQHKNIKELILKYRTQFLEFGTFSVLNGQSSGGRREQYYLLNEPQATFLLTLLRNTKIVIDFKMNLVKQFYAMRKILLEKQSNEWQHTRTQSKLTRKCEAETLKELVYYAENQGSTHATMIYMTYSKLANKMVGISNRELATTSQLNYLSMIENIILHCIKNGMSNEKHYSDIYQDPKNYLQSFSQMAYLTAS